MPIGSSEKIKKYLGYKAFFVVNTILLVMLIGGVGREYIRRVSIENELAELEVARSAETSKMESLLTAKEYLESQEFVESEAREKFGLAEAGETVVVVDESFGSRNSILQSAPPPPNWLLWKWYFFDSERLKVE